MTNKYDLIFLPALYGAYTFGRVAWLRWGLTTGALSAATVGTLLVLSQVFPGGFSSEPITQLIPRMLDHNWKAFLELGVSHPPLLIFLLPAALAIPRLFSRDRLVWTSAGLGFALIVIHILLVKFHEVRNQLPALVLLLPAALFNLRAFLERPSDESTPGP
ncbi:MAG: hypothetical protein JRH10_02505 [Deltaproteobacteria bacterium]|nr:hypothetical protein [Deltaproteobacteria bacterium]MBW2447959.1 hypothetical protein [Deltaproteobacteria bacterium]